MSGKRILIVEDEAVTALHLCEELTRLGYEVGTPATSGEESVRLAEELEPDLVLMDIKLAGTMDGVEASRRIREHRPIPVLYLTAYPGVFVESPTRMQEPGICVSKPLSWPALQTAIEIALSSSPDFCVPVFVPQ